MKSIYTVIALVAILLISCDSENKSALLEEKLSLSKLAEISKKVAEDPDIDMFDLRYYQKGLVNFINNRDSVSKYTVGDIIQMQKDKEKGIITTDLLQNAKFLEFNLNLGFKLAKISPADVDSNKMNVMRYQFFNNTDQDIKHVKGMVKILARSNGALIKQFPVDFTEVVPAKKGLQKNMPYVHDDANQRDQLIRNPQALLKFEWYPELIEFADGAKIEMPVVASK